MLERFFGRLTETDCLFTYRQIVAAWLRGAFIGFAAAMWLVLIGLMVLFPTRASADPSAACPGVTMLHRWSADDPNGLVLDGANIETWVDLAGDCDLDVGEDPDWQGNLGGVRATTVTMPSGMRASLFDGDSWYECLSGDAGFSAVTQPFWILAAFNPIIEGRATGDGAIPSLISGVSYTSAKAQPWFDLKPSLNKPRIYAGTSCATDTGATWAPHQWRVMTGKYDGASSSILLRSYTYGDVSVATCNAGTNSASSGWMVPWQGQRLAGNIGEIIVTKDADNIACLQDYLEAEWLIAGNASTPTAGVPTATPTPTRTSTNTPTQPASPTPTETPPPAATCVTVEFDLPVTERTDNSGAQGWVGKDNAATAQAPPLSISHVASSNTKALAGQRRTQYLYFSRLKSSAVIPVGATVAGVRLRVDAYSTAANVHVEQSVKAVGSDFALGTEEKSTGYTLTTDTSPFVTRIYGGFADLWGESWCMGCGSGFDLADPDTGFVFAYEDDRAESALTRTVRVYYAVADVCYTGGTPLPDTPTPTGTPTPTPTGPTATPTETPDPPNTSTPTDTPTETPTPTETETPGTPTPGTATPTATSTSTPYAPRTHGLDSPPEGWAYDGRICRGPRDVAVAGVPLRAGTCEGGGGAVWDDVPIPAGHSGPIAARVSAYKLAADAATGTLRVACSARCVHAGHAVDGSFGGAAAATIDVSTYAQGERMTALTGEITPTGTCDADAQLYVGCRVSGAPSPAALYPLGPLSIELPGDAPITAIVGAPGALWPDVASCTGPVPLALGAVRTQVVSCATVGGRVQLDGELPPEYSGQDLRVRVAQIALADGEAGGWTSWSCAARCGDPGATGDSGGTVVPTDLASRGQWVADWTGAFTPAGTCEAGGSVWVECRIDEAPARLDLFPLAGLVVEVVR